MLRYWAILFSLIGSVCLSEIDMRQEAIKLIQGSDFKNYLEAPVRISKTPEGPLLIIDEGIYFFQYDLQTPAVSAMTDVVKEGEINLPETADHLVIVTHGWLDKSEGRWPGEIAYAIDRWVDPNEWTCASFGWKGGAGVVNSVQAARYARDIAGPRLAVAILELEKGFTHIHFIGHSAGAWVIDSAAKQMAAAMPQADFHLTFLDAYVPDKWEPDILGHLFEDPQKQKNQVWADHYYTRDITYKVTQHDLKYARNVDISALDPFVVEHEFPYRWYMATITGKYQRWDEKNEKVFTQSGSVDYGFLRSLESGRENYQQSRKLKTGNKSVKIKKVK